MVQSLFNSVVVVIGVKAGRTATEEEEGEERKGRRRGVCVGDVGGEEGEEEGCLCGGCVRGWRTASLPMLEEGSRVAVKTMENCRQFGISEDSLELLHIACQASQGSLCHTNTY